MRNTVASVLAALFVLAPALAQTQTAAPPPVAPPVDKTQGPENEITNPDPATPPKPVAVADPATPPKPAKWDVNAPTGAVIRQVKLDVTEGSWMDLDVSPDGRTIAFTLLGDIYSMPIAGGTPRRIAEGLAWEVQPRFSPDGTRIAFTSDRGGGDNIWTMNADGSNKQQVTKEEFRLLNQPSWSPDGKYIAAKKHFTTGRSLGTGEVWLYHASGGGGVLLVKRASEQLQKELGEPTFAPDGKGIYYTRNITRGPIFEYAQDSNTDLFNIERYDMDTTEVTTVASGAGGSVRPAPSPDGKLIAFVRRERTKSKLYVRDLASGEERKIYDALDQDVQETWAVTGVYPNMDWTPDSKSVVFWAGGKIRRVDADGSRAAEIPFRVNDMRGMIDGPHPQIEVSPDRFTTRMPRWAQASPDGRTIVFEKTSGGGVTSPRWGENPGAYRIATSGGAMTRIAKDVAEPHFGAANDRVFMVAQAKDKRQLISTDLNGEAKRVHASGDLVTAYQVAPDGQSFAFRQNYEAFAMPLLPGAQEVSVETKGGPLPVTKVSNGGADWLHWSGTRLNWSIGPTLYTVAAPTLFASAPQGENAPKFKPPTTGVVLGMAVTADRPSGTLVLTGARVVTMADASGGIIDDGVVVVTGGRIVAVGKRGAVAIPAGAKTIDVTGKTIIPGLVDAHAHGPQGSDELVPQQNWSLVQNLALGTTTIHDPSSRSAEIFPAAEMQRAGLILGPRIFSTGEIVYGAKAADVYAQIDSLDDALAHVRRLKAQGAHSVKNYNQPRREQRQQVVAAARQENMQVVAEGGSLFGMDMNLIADGNSTLEHNVPLGVFYEDVVSFFAASKTAYTPTLVVSYGGPAGDPYWRQATDIYDHPLLKAHTPPAELAADGARRVKAPESDYVDDDNAREATKVARRGVLVSIGAHGQQAGIGSHWELWSFVRGGMTPVEALAAGTITAAKSLGMAKDIGSLEVGKLADLVVLDADPTTDIRNSDKVRQVMLGGRLYDAATMNEVTTGTRKRLKYYWE